MRRLSYHRLLPCVLVLLLFVFPFSMGGCNPPMSGDGNNNSNNNDNGNDNTDPPPGQGDSDNDGVRNDQDNCPNTPANTTVDASGCPTVTADSDSDGVPDSDDDCPNTPANTTVDASGCPVSDPGTPDADEDGVADDIDLCPQTPTAATVDANGCAAAQRDTDADGVMDDADRCTGTTAGTQVDARGCPIVAPGDPDADADGITDAQDDCANTPANSVVDPNGCAAGQLDADDDGVSDAIDQCPNTPAATVVDANGCASTQRDSDRDGVDDSLDQCANTPVGTAVDASGCPTGGGGGTGSACGNSTVETGEQCDPPNGTTCDVNCQTTVGGALANNNCTAPTAISGTIDRSFSNTGASTDGRDEPGQCVIQNYTQVDSDIWYCYTATCTEEVVVSLCGSSYDTKMMVYNGCACPSAAPITCSDDNCGTGQDSRASFAAVSGQAYMIRIGGFRNAQGTGQLTVFCGSDPAHGLKSCSSGTGDCFAAHANAGCAVQDACERTCDVDQFCCDTEWDARCAEKADGIINGFDACGAPGSGSCLSASTSPGCLDQPCCQSVCERDPFCCTNEWDDLCAESVGTECGVFAACTGAQGSCFSVHTNPGCNVEGCCNAVCAADGACCTDTWDDVCTQRAITLRQSGQCR